MTYTVSGAYCSTCQVQPDPAAYFDVLPLGISNFGQVSLIVAGTGDEENTYHWGQYAATVIDPTDKFNFLQPVRVPQHESNRYKQLLATGERLLYVADEDL